KYYASIQSAFLCRVKLALVGRHIITSPFEKKGIEGDLFKKHPLTPRQLLYASPKAPTVGALLPASMQSSFSKRGTEKLRQFYPS
ncbi:MAG: hypothetical protein LUO94_08255, partial [Methylococcaceae bacterium]|nr:hypothetical protein [Methylococcaceae bacterium]